MKKLKYVLLGVVAVVMIALSAPFSNFIGVQTARFYNEIFLYNTSGTLKFSLDNNGTITTSSAVAVIDSMYGTAVSDTVAMSGATVGDVFSVTQYCPDYSTTPDTNVTYYASVLSAGNVLVSRAKNTSTADLKSNALFCLVKLDR